MYAERLMRETAVAGNLMNMPKLSSNMRLEAIYLVVSDSKNGESMRLCDL